MHNEIPILVALESHTTSANAVLYTPCSLCDAGRSPGFKIFMRRQYNEEREAQKTALWMMHTNRLARQVLLEYWKNYLMSDDWNRRVRDMVVGVLDQLFDQTGRHSRPFRLLMGLLSRRTAAFERCGAILPWSNLCVLEKQTGSSVEAQG